MIIRDVVALSEVASDINDGELFYEKSEIGVGRYFRDSIISDIESLLIYAGVHSKKFGFYRMVAKRFPYAIYYHIHNEIAIVIAVLAMRKNPVWIQTRLQGRIA